jgi:lysophospholipase L1-like esterase
MRPGVARRILFAFVALGAVLVLLNGLAASAEWVCHGTRWSRGQPVGLYESRAGEAPRLRRGARLRGLCHSIHVNAEGFRGPELAVSKPPEGLRLWFAGGSTTFDIFAPDDAGTWPAIAGARVQEAVPDRRVEVINAGVPAEVLEGNRARLLADGPRLRPDIVVVYPGPNDLREVMFRPGRAALSPLTAYEEIALVRTLERWRLPRAARSARLPAGSLSPEQELRLRTSLSRILEAARQVGALPVLVTHALRVRPGAGPAEAQDSLAEATVLLGVDGSSTLAAYDTVDRLVRELASRMSVPMIDLRAAIPADEALWGDATHFAAAGSVRAGDHVGAALVGLLRARTDAAGRSAAPTPASMDPPVP